MWKKARPGLVKFINLAYYIGMVPVKCEFSLSQRGQQYYEMATNNFQMVQILLTLSFIQLCVIVAENIFCSTVIFFFFFENLFRKFKFSKILFLATVYVCKQKIIFVSFFVRYFAALFSLSASPG